MEKKFPWGRTIEIMEIGPYKVRSFHPLKRDGATILDTHDPDTIHYHGYIDGKDCNESWLTLDEALAGLIVRRALGPNSSQINYHFMAGISAMAK